jgi:hypothetical protein
MFYIAYFIFVNIVDLINVFISKYFIHLKLHLQN